MISLSATKSTGKSQEFLESNANLRALVHWSCTGMVALDMILAQTGLTVGDC
jgi:hypothetical protein